MRHIFATLMVLVACGAARAQAVLVQAPPVQSVSIQQAPPTVKPCGCSYGDNCACIVCNCEQCLCYDKCPGKIVAEGEWEEWLVNGQFGWWRNKKTGAWRHTTQGYFPPGGLYYLEPAANPPPQPQPQHYLTYQPTYSYYPTYQPTHTWYGSSFYYCGPSG